MRISHALKVRGGLFGTRLGQEKQWLELRRPVSFLSDRAGSERPQGGQRCSQQRTFTKQDHTLLPPYIIQKLDFSHYDLQRLTAATWVFGFSLAFPRCLLRSERIFLNRPRHYTYGLSHGTKKRDDLLHPDYFR